MKYDVNDTDSTSLGTTILKQVLSALKIVEKAKELGFLGLNYALASVVILFFSSLSFVTVSHIPRPNASIDFVISENKAGTGYLLIRHA